MVLLAERALEEEGFARPKEHLAALQETLLPLPRAAFDTSALTGVLQAAPIWQILFVIAVSPGICEELIFRGPILWGLKQDLKPGKVILWQALLFGATHASIYRLAPTAIAGALLAAVTLRARSIWPAVVLHVTYDAWMGMQLLDSIERVAWPDAAWMKLTPLLAIVGIVLLTVVRPRTAASER